MSDEIEITNAKEALDAVKKNGRMIAEVPEELITAELVELCLKYGEKDGYTLSTVLEHVPGKFITAKLIEMCIKAVEKDRMNDKAKKMIDHQEGAMMPKTLLEHMKFIPENLWRAELSELCLDMVKKSGTNLSNVPEKQITAEMANEAVKQKYEAFKYVPDPLKTTQMCIDVLKHDFFGMLKFVPKELMTEELSEVALEKIKQKPDSFKKIPDELKTTKMALEAVKANSRLLEDVPDNLRTAEVYHEAVKKDVKIIEQVPDELKTMEMCLDVVKKRGMSIEYVPDKFKTEELCLIAVESGAGAIELIPENKRTEKLIEAAKKGGWIPPTKNVSADQLTSMDAYNKILEEQMANMPPEVREQMLKAMGKK
ncbi:MAG: DUF4116 domain-containing protein [Treponema sp.]|nr:DUF4116 domain-containing protein [Treponema sp.]